MNIQEQFRALREDNKLLREEVREDIKGLHAKLDKHTAAINSRCAQRGEEIAVLMNHEKQRERRIDRRITYGMLIVAAISVLLRLLL